MTDVGNAQRFAKDHRDRLRLSVHLNTWIDYTGKRWRRDMMRVVKICAQQTVKAIFREALALGADKRKQLLKWAFQSEAASRLNAMIGERELSGNTIKRLCWALDLQLAWPDGTFVSSGMCKQCFRLLPSNAGGRRQYCTTCRPPRDRRRTIEATNHAKR